MEYIALLLYYFFFFNDTATTEIYTLSLHDALPILSAVRSCRSLPRSGEKLRLGRIAVTCVPGTSASWLTRSAAHRVSLRSGQTTNSSDTLRSGSHAARSRSACSLSMAKCTARTVVG